MSLATSLANWRRLPLLGFVSLATAAMTRESVTQAFAAAQAGLQHALQETRDPGAQQHAILNYFSWYAGVAARVFFEQLLIAPQPVPHRGAEDLEKHAAIVLREQIGFMLQELFESGFVEVVPGATIVEVAGRAFYDTINALIAAVPPAGHA